MFQKMRRTYHDYLTGAYRLQVQANGVDRTGNPDSTAVPAGTDKGAME